IPNPERWDMKILATDISTRILKRATEGVYDSNRVAPVPANLKQRFLTRKKQNNQTFYEVTQQLKSKITFKYLNLMNEFPFKGPLDFIFCRNVMIYFDKQTQERLINRYYNLLAPGGILFTGHSESLTGVRHHFSYVQPTIYKKG
ncbi:MAG: CheR family methyltransferase, partial [Planctomycetota bacterium]